LQEFKVNSNTNIDNPFILFYKKENSNKLLFLAND